jgi:hypothetical protein
MALRIFPLSISFSGNTGSFRRYINNRVGGVESRSHQLNERNVVINEPHVGPIVRGKSRSKTEFGAKIRLSLIDG